MTDAILVDFDGVLRFWPESDEAIEAAHGLPRGCIRAVAFARERLDPALTGQVTDQAWRTGVASALVQQFGPGGGQAVADWSKGVGAIDWPTLSLLRKATERLVLVTNATSRLRSDLAVLGLSDVFSAVVNSSEIGVRKPDPRCFAHALEAAGVTAGEALYIDDTQANVVVAAGMGIRSHHFTRRETMVAFLRRHGVRQEAAS